MPREKVERTRGGAVHLAVATAIGGGSGYLLTVIAGGALGPAGYATFAVFWSALYLLISAVSGIQPEIARATAPTADGGTRRPVARNFAVLAAGAIFAFTVLSGIALNGIVFPQAGEALVLPLALGVAFYAIVAVVAGVFYGLGLWASIAAMISIDGLLRLVIVSGLLLFSHDLVVLAWGVILPFILTPIGMWLAVRSRVVGRFRLDVGYRALTWNVARTVVGAAATGVLISGFPLLLGATSTHESPEAIAPLIFGINVTRAPIVIVVLAFQSYLVIFFRTRVKRFWPSLGLALLVIAVGTAIVAIIVAAVGPWVFETFFGPGYVLPAEVLAALVGSGGAVAAMCAAGPLLIALHRHGWYTAGWVIAAIVTIGALLLPLGLYERTLLALWVGPIAGLAVHLVGVMLRDESAAPAHGLAEEPV